MTTPSPNGHRAERDGCGCAQFEMEQNRIIQCCHYQGQAMHLHETGRDASPFVVCGPSEDSDDGLRPSRDFADLPAAEAEFRERERQLLEAVDA